MIKLSASAVRGFVEECYRKGLNEQQAAYLLERSIETSDSLLYKRAADDEGKGDEGKDDEWEETTREEFFAKHPEAKEMYETPKYRKDPRYASFIDAMGKETKIYSKKGNPYLFKWDPLPAKKDEDEEKEKEASFEDDNYEKVDREQFLRENPEASALYHNNEARKNPRLARFFATLDGGQIKKDKRNGRYLV